ncbi:MAG: hypothetical protein M3680_24480 [Myxococcota bacterium]|nr:hypothetical protein [Myxococcota bacterium]
MTMRRPLTSPTSLTSLLLIATAACGGEGSTPTIDAPPAAIDAAADATTSGSCTGACTMTQLTATFGSVTRTLDRAVYGITQQPLSIRVEAHRGGMAGCPTASSPTPDYTLILARVPAPPATGTTPGNLLGFKGDLLNGALGAAATMVTSTVVASEICPTCFGMPAPSDPDGFIALDLALTFNGGTVTGHLYATHCDSLDSAD